MNTLRSQARESAMLDRIELYVPELFRLCQYTEGRLGVDESGSPVVLHDPLGLSAEDFLLFAPPGDRPALSGIRRVRNSVVSYARINDGFAPVTLDDGNKLVKRACIEQLVSKCVSGEYIPSEVGAGSVAADFISLLLRNTRPRL